MRFHLVAPPNTQTTMDYSLDGFTVATINFAKMLKMLGHTVVIYGSEENEAPCDDFVTCISKDAQQNLLKGFLYQYAGFDNRHELWAAFNAEAITAIHFRRQPRDFICLIGGVSQKPIADAFPDMMTVEYSIGYEGCFSPYRVYESAAWRNTVQAQQGQKDGRFFDAVIPYFFDPEHFQFTAHKEDFLLYVGRLTPRKGIGIACEVAAKAGLPLKVIGHGDASLVTHGAEYLGAVDNRTRNSLLGRARALLAPTQYIEPFGSVVVEAALCGTPAITTNFGAFVETVEHGRTGFRCDYLGEFAQAVSDLPRLWPEEIRMRAVSRYSINNIAAEYQKYFERLNFLWAAGWNTVQG